MTLIKVRKNGMMRPRFSSMFDQLFNNDLGMFLGRDSNENLPAANVVETSDDYQLELAAPGLTKKDLMIDIVGDELRIEGNKENGENSNYDRWTRREFNYSNFKRSFTLPNTVEGSKISAKYEDGILQVIIPKKESERQELSRNIKIV